MPVQDLGVAVRKGAPKPDIGQFEGFKRALLAASSVVRSKDGTSGLYFETLLERLGIAEEMRGKIRLGGSGRIAELVASGEVGNGGAADSGTLAGDWRGFRRPVADGIAALHGVFGRHRLVPARSWKSQKRLSIH